MAINYRLMTDPDFQEAVDQQIRVRVFKSDLLIESSAVIIRFDEQLVVTQSGVSEVTYHHRGDCEFFALRKR
ncbi:hypothetical protein ACFOQM_14060 [Paenibacillus sp. GCM10012307]|uniref:Uncharacterized protein n=1 Tax=Paenibacillus roseus TaxID=2798579 RepID=A0A934J8K0_9BACL|nr:hypothetical protein [Paenibacillus roseus]MBJ6362407.1 hypothetical protein [Paenibacillus roseus]